MEVKNVKIRFYNGVQFLRAICCICIVLAHSFAYAEMIFRIPECAYWGRYGMLNLTTFFFIMSAYLTTEKLDLANSNLGEFFKSRFWGIYPIYWLCVVTVVMYNLMVYHNIQVSNGFWRSLLLIPGGTTFVCSVEWTLWYEIIFYSLICWFFAIKKGKNFFPYIVLIFIVCYIVKYDGANLTDNIYKIPLSRPFLAFPVGVTIYYLEKVIKHLFRHNNEKNITFNSKLIWILCAFLFIVCIYMLDERYFDTYSIVHLLLAVAVASICFISFKVIGISKENFFVSIGNATYGIYLLHPTFIKNSFYILYSLGVKYTLSVHIIVVLVNTLACFALGSSFKIIIKTLQSCVKNYFKRKW